MQLAYVHLEHQMLHCTRQLGFQMSQSMSSCCVTCSSSAVEKTVNWSESMESVLVYKIFLLLPPFLAQSGYGSMCFHIRYMYHLMLLKQAFHLWYKQSGMMAYSCKCSNTIIVLSWYAYGWSKTACMWVGLRLNACGWGCSKNRKCIAT